MAYSDFTYDPWMSTPANKIVNEEQVVNIAVDRGVFPVHGAFHSASLTVEGFIGGVWVPFSENKEYVLSPLFVNASAVCVGEIFTYYVLTTDAAVTKVRHTYHVLGQYVDELLLAMIATTQFDRSDVYEWRKIYGTAALFSPVVRHPALRGKNVLEVFNAQLERMLIAISNPHTGNNFTAHDQANIYAQLANMVTVPQLEAFYTYPTATRFVEANTPRSIYEFPESANYISGEILFKGVDNSLESVSFKSILTGAIPKGTLYAELSSIGDSITFSFEIAKYGSQYRIIVTPQREGDFIFKSHSQLI